VNTPSTCYRWTICTVLFFATTINYIHRQILSLVKPLLDDELHWTNEQLGVVNSAFHAAYASGLLGFGTKIGYALAITLWSIAAMSHALVGSITGFRWARMFLGVSEAGIFPAAIKTVAQWFARSERAFATTLFNSGANVGAIVAPASIPFIAAAWGWRAAFVAAGIAGFVWLMFWWLMDEAPEKHARVSPVELPVTTSDRADTQTDNKTKGLDIKKLGLPLVTLYVIVPALSLAGGWLANALVRRGWSENRTRKTCRFIFALAVLPILLVKDAGLRGAAVLIGIAGAAHQAWSANLFTPVSDMFSKGAIGTVIVIGGILFPIYSGRLLDRFTASGDLNTGHAVLFGICAAACLLAFELNHHFARRFTQITQLES
jgi:ACS family hexuronate transporter-like MFS transporter